MPPPPPHTHTHAHTHPMQMPRAHPTPQATPMTLHTHHSHALTTQYIHSNTHTHPRARHTTHHQSQCATQQTRTSNRCPNLRHRSEHCLGVRPGRLAATRTQSCPASVTNSSSPASCNKEGARHSQAHGPHATKWTTKVAGTPHPTSHRKKSIHARETATTAKLGNWGPCVSLRISSTG